MANKPTIKRAPLGADLLMRRRALAMPTACLRQRYLRVDLDFEAFEGDRSMVLGPVDKSGYSAGAFHFFTGKAQTTQQCAPLQVIRNAVP